MPNWNENFVEIAAPLEEVKDYLVEVHEIDGTVRHMFNMHKIFPDKFPIDDPLGQDNWNYEWFCKHTGSKWSPYIEYLSWDENGTELGYDTARVPNSGTLMQLHRLTGWPITNHYEEPGMQFCGQYICAGGHCTDVEGDYQTSCEICEKKRPDEDYDDEHDGLICARCRDKGRYYRDDGVTLVRPEGS